MNWLVMIITVVLRRVLMVGDSVSISWSVVISNIIMMMTLVWGAIPSLIPVPTATSLSHFYAIFNVREPAIVLTLVLVDGVTASVALAV